MIAVLPANKVISAWGRIKQHIDSALCRSPENYTQRDILHMIKKDDLRVLTMDGDGYECVATFMVRVVNGERHLHIPTLAASIASTFCLS